jgi:TctA family transporter
MREKRRIRNSGAEISAIAGTLDIIAAHLYIWAAKGRFPATLLKSIAGGALGMERAKQGGVAMLALGALFHYFIAFVFTLLFFLLFPRVDLVRKNRYAVGAAYAIFVSSVMDYVVLPLSALHWPPPSYTSVHTYIGWAMLTSMFGIPIAMGAASYYERSGPGA